MVWAPSAIWDAKASQFHLFWSSRHYAASDRDHAGKANLDRIRHASTADFRTFSAPKDYAAFGATPVIDHEFLHLGGDSWARFIKNETAKVHVFQELSSNGLFGTWRRKGGFAGLLDPQEGAASFADNEREGRYYVLLDDYKQYIPFETTDIRSGTWKRVNWRGFPGGLKHGSVTPVTKEEWERLRQKYPP